MQRARELAFTISMLSFQLNLSVINRILEVPSTVLFQRNGKRDTTLTQKDLERMLHRWELPLPWEAHEVRYEATESQRAHTRTR